MKNLIEKKMVFIVSCNLYTENEKQNKKKIRNLNKTILKEKKHQLFFMYQSKYSIQ